MALYTTEEICNGCRHAVWHDCEKCEKRNFCHCAIDAGDCRDGVSGKCSRREESDAQS